MNSILRLLMEKSTSFGCYPIVSRAGSSCITHLTTDGIMTLIGEPSLHAAEVVVVVIDTVVHIAHLACQEHLPSAHQLHPDVANSGEIHM